MTHRPSARLALLAVLVAASGAAAAADAPPAVDAAPAASAPTLIDGNVVRRIHGTGKLAVAREMALQCADERRDADCQRYAGAYLLKGLGGPKDVERGMKYTRLAAQQGDAVAEAMLGRQYREGVGTAKDDTQALAWYEASARHCNTWAQNAVARAYADGDFVPADRTRALFWISVAAHFLHPGAEAGVQVVQAQATPAEREAAKKLLDEFMAGTKCGKGMAVMNAAP